jgi:hypothetical protein
MEEYNEQCDTIYNTALNAINSGYNVVICGPECSGKTYTRNKLALLLRQNDYTLYYGVDHYKDNNKFHGKTYTDDKFWIEEINKNALSDMLNSYEYIETKLQFPGCIKLY